MYRGDDDGDGKGDTKCKTPTTYHVTITYIQHLHIYTVDRGPWDRSYIGIYEWIDRWSDRWTNEYGKPIKYTLQEIWRHLWARDRTTLFANIANIHRTKPPTDSRCQKDSTNYDSETTTNKRTTDRRFPGQARARIPVQKFGRRICSLGLSLTFCCLLVI